MTRGVLHRLRGAVVAGAITLAATRVLAAQDWRAQAIATFDEIWQTVQDTFYDPTFGGLDWNAVKAELRPKVEAATSAEAARQIDREMLARLKRSHFGLITSAPSGALPGPAMAPIDVRIIPEGVVVVDVQLGGLGGLDVHPGDLVTSIDAQPVANLVSAAEGATPRARQLDAWRRVFSALHGAAGSMADIELRTPAGTVSRAKLERRIESGQAVNVGNLPPLYVRTNARVDITPNKKKVGVISFNLWMTAVAGPFETAIDTYRLHDGLVIDLRGNPGGLADMIRGIAGQFVSNRDLLGQMHMRQATLEFRVNPRFSTSDGRRVVPFAGPVAILVDELTASASECFTGGLQSLGRVRVFGRQTMGQALPAATRQLSNGDVLLYAVGDFITSTGRSLEGEGVIPDESVPLRIEDLSKGKDATLAAAFAWIDRAK